MEYLETNTSTQHTYSYTGYIYIEGWVTDGRLHHLVTFAFIRTNVYVYMYIYTYTYMCNLMYVHVYICIISCMYMYVYMRAREPAPF